MYSRLMTAWRTWVWEKLWETEIRGKTWRMIKNMTECATSAVMLDGEILNYVDILQELDRNVRYHLIYSRQTLNDMIVAVEAAKQGVTVGGDSVGIDVCELFRGYVRNTRRLADTFKEGNKSTLGNEE